MAMGRERGDPVIAATACAAGVEQVTRLLALAPTLGPGESVRENCPGDAGRELALELRRQGYLPLKRTTWVAFDCVPGAEQEANAANLMAAMFMNTPGHGALVTDPNGQYGLGGQRSNPVFVIQLVDLRDSADSGRSRASSPVPAAAAAPKEASEVGPAPASAPATEERARKRSRSCSRASDEAAPESSAGPPSVAEVAQAEPSATGEPPLGSSSGASSESSDNGASDLMKLLGFQGGDSGASGPAAKRASLAARIGSRGASGGTSLLTWLEAPVPSLGDGAKAVVAMVAHGRALLSLPGDPKSVTSIETMTKTVVGGKVYIERRMIKQPAPPLPDASLPAHSLSVPPLYAEAVRCVIGNVAIDVQPNIITASFDSATHPLGKGAYQSAVCTIAGSVFWQVMSRLRFVLRQPAARRNLAVTASAWVLRKPRMMGKAVTEAEAVNAAAFAVAYAELLTERIQPTEEVARRMAASSREFFAAEASDCGAQPAPRRCGDVGTRAAAARSASSAVLSMTLPLYTDSVIVGTVSPEQDEVVTWMASSAMCIGQLGMWMLHDLHPVAAPSVRDEASAAGSVGSGGSHSPTPRLRPVPLVFASAHAGGGLSGAPGASGYGRGGTLGLAERQDLMAGRVAAGGGWAHTF